MTDSRSCDFCNNRELALRIISSTHSETMVPGYNSVVTLGVEGRRIGLECSTYDPINGVINTEASMNRTFKINYCPNCGQKL